MDKEEILDNGCVPVIGIRRHRIFTDGGGETRSVGTCVRGMMYWG